MLTPEQIADAFNTAGVTAEQLARLPLALAVAGVLESGGADTPEKVAATLVPALRAAKLRQLEKARDAVQAAQSAALAPFNDQARAVQLQAYAATATYREQAAGIQSQIDALAAQL